MQGSLALIADINKLLKADTLALEEHATNLLESQGQSEKRVQLLEERVKALEAELASEKSQKAILRDELANQAIRLDKEIEESKQQISELEARNKGLEEEAIEARLNALEERLDMQEQKTDNMVMSLQDPALEEPLQNVFDHSKVKEVRTLNDLANWVGEIDKVADKVVNHLAEYTMVTITEIHKTHEQLDDLVASQQEQIESLKAMVLENQSLIKNLKQDQVKPKSSNETAQKVGARYDSEDESEERPADRLKLSVPPIYKSAKIPKMRKFQEDDSPHTWLNEAVWNLMQEGVDPARWTAALSANFDGMTKIWWKTLLRRCDYVVPWDTFKKEFLEEYKDRETKRKTIERLHAIKFTEMNKYVMEFQCIIREAPPGMIPDEQWRLHFLQSLPLGKYFDLKRKQKKKPSKDIDTLLMDTLDFEKEREEREEAEKCAAAAATKNEKSKDGSVKQGSKQTSSSSLDKKSESSTTAKDKKPASKTGRAVEAAIKKGTCFNCDEHGHWVADCPYPHRKQGKGGAKGMASKDKTRA